MNITARPIEGLWQVQPRVFEDERGFFYESYNAVAFAAAGLPTDWAQDNHSRSVRGTLRGLHFQKGPGQAKLVRCARGAIWDVAVDIRPGSPTLGRWHAAELSEQNRAMICMTEGFAHGFVVLSEAAEVLYKCSTVYDAGLESEIAWNDPELGVDWPVADPILSPRDRQARSFREYLNGLMP